MMNECKQSSFTNCKASVFVLMVTSVGVCSYFYLRTSKNDQLSGKFGPADEYAFQGISHQQVFIELDRDGDGQLSFGEFVNIRNHFKISAVDNTNLDLSENYHIQLGTDLPTNEDDHLITLKAAFVPLVVQSLTKDISSIPSDQIGALEGLLSWKVPLKESQSFPTSSFSIFLPPHDTLLSPGSTWWIVNSILDESMSPMSSTRYFPPKVESKFHPLFALLSMFHPQPFLWTRFAPQGTVAVLRAVGSEYFDIVFRMHAEFQLNKPPLLPFWFTPSQFHGRLIISRDGSKVLHFHLEVPNTKKLNVDMEWLNGPGEENMEVDIGYLPQMSISSFHDASNMPDESEENLYYENWFHDQEVDLLAWLKEIPVNDAFSVLESSMYSFKKVKYYNITEAFHVANSKSMLIHGILLWGALDDQSC